MNGMVRSNRNYGLGEADEVSMARSYRCRNPIRFGQEIEQWETLLDLRSSIPHGSLHVSIDHPLSRKNQAIRFNQSKE